MRLSLSLIGLSLFVNFSCGEQKSNAELKANVHAPFYIHSGDGLCLDIPHWSNNNGEWLTWWWCDGSAKQRWVPVDAGNGRFLLRSDYNNKALDFQGGGSDKVVQNDWLWNDHQKFANIGSGLHASGIGFLCAASYAGETARQGCGNGERVWLEN